MRWAAAASTSIDRADCEAAWIQDPQWTLTTEGGKVPTTFAEWLDSLLRPSRWICRHTLIAASRRLGVHITVLIEEADKVTPIQMRRSNSTADTRVLHLKNNHYQVIVPDPHRPWPAEWTDLADILGKVSRGGGHKQSEAPSTPTRPKIHMDQPSTSKRSSSSSSRTPNWMPKDTPESTPLRTPAWLPEHLTLLQPRNHKPKRPESTATVEKRSFEEIIPPTNPKTSSCAKPKIFSWPCNICGRVIKGTTALRLSQDRGSHMSYSLQAF